MANVTGNDIKRLREKREWSQQDLAEVLNRLLDRNYAGGYISQFETGNRKIPAAIAAAVEELLIDANLAPLGEPPTPSLDGAPPETAPTHGDGTAAQDIPPPPLPPGQEPLLAATGGTYARACAELWEIIAMGWGTMGAAIGNRAMVADGEIILADKDALGEAWGRLAETNAAFRKMIAGALEGGAWMQVILCTGSTAAKCWQNHQAYARYMAEQAVNNGSSGAENVSTATA